MIKQFKNRMLNYILSTFILIEFVALAICVPI